MRFSAQTLSVLAALSSNPSSWRHGYDLAKETALKSGTLYPILIRLAVRGLVEATWEAEQPAGRPRRHLYRLTAAGRIAATAAIAATEANTATEANSAAAPPPAKSARAGRRRIVIEGA
jgi:PadR family transcriptional regulator PadR